MITPFEFAFGVGFLVMLLAIGSRDIFATAVIGCALLFGASFADPDATWLTVADVFSGFVSHMRASNSEAAYVQTLVYILFLAAGVVFTVSRGWRTVAGEVLDFAAFVGSKLSAIPFIKQNFCVSSIKHNPKINKISKAMREVSPCDIVVAYNDSIDQLQVFAVVPQVWMGQRILRKIEVVSGSPEYVASLLRSIPGGEEFFSQGMSETPANVSALGV